MLNIRNTPIIAVGIVVALATTACANGQVGMASNQPLPAQTGPAQSTPSAQPSSAAIVNTWSGATVNLKSLPLGDGNLSTTASKSGSVYSCTGGNEARAGGPMETQPWIHGKTWDMTAKAVVEGKVTWPTAAFKVTNDAQTRTITTNSLPVDTATGEFPIAPSDPAHEYDRNPNSIGEHATTIKLPVNPQKSATPQCLPMGAIGVMLNGVLLFNALDAAGRDGVAHEVQDVCQGHPARGELYHYHDVPSCLRDAATGPSTVVGWAYDGFPIVVERDAAGKLPTNADLDECHGRTSPILLNGKVVTTYHYDATLEYPYTIGCFAAPNAVGRTAR